ncbi:L,D-transpeptidase [Candidatus Desulforudis audaxviator]|uniref:ErfK/YbiS/YcfS/YnhG family protein n=1 Tax=Desulforudis audaxviator (strain MP104C) TaxID=477974 RepID=B1I221_DESAP|nr:L,D-transpeptidase [Candidatus Desulforudis audaxviator]ACA58980.1 ErfK/YbiS/YcfS/YnhG family protein [Candidatus Desulforudis audaxviator MP104C]AZK59019.1 ErfK/YbiS/YcfS/YnhG family protein [Candidatus Desulforudis audaxviator]
MKRALYVLAGLLAGLAILLVAAGQFKPWNYHFPPDKRPLPRAEIVYRDGENLVFAGSGGVTVRNQAARTEFRLPVSAGKIQTVQRLHHKTAQELPLLGWAVVDGLKVVTGGEVYLVRTKPDARLLAVYPRPKSGGDRIIINKSANRLYFYQGGELAVIYSVATGKRPEYTPEGTFTVVNKVSLPGDNDSDPRFGLRWLGLAVPCEKDRRRENDPRAPGGIKYGIHGTNEPDSIGTHASGGCVRLRNEDIVELFELVTVGTTVDIIP